MHAESQTKTDRETETERQTDRHPCAMSTRQDNTYTKTHIHINTNKKRFLFYIVHAMISCTGLLPELQRNVDNNICENRVKIEDYNLKIDIYLHSEEGIIRSILKLGKVVWCSVGEIMK